MPPDPPIPIGATFNLLAARLDVTFHLELEPGPIDPTNWTLVFGNQNWTFANADVAGAVAHMRNGVGAGFNPGPHTCTYAPPPFDVLNLVGDPAAAFAGFPVV